MIGRRRLLVVRLVVKFDDMSVGRGDKIVVADEGALCTPDPLPSAMAALANMGGGETSACSGFIGPCTDDHDEDSFRY